MTGDTALRDAGPGDAAAVAALHAASWRASYRGILADAYLDGPVAADRLDLWRGRLAGPVPGLATVLAERGGDLVGFGCLLIGEDLRWGSLVDNVHTGPGDRGLGLGRLLMQGMAARAAAGAPGRPLHLFCWEDNRAARGFYERLGGTVVERLSHDGPDGGTHPCVRYAWPAPEALAAPRR